MSDRPSPNSDSEFGAGADSRNPSAGRVMVKRGRGPYFAQVPWDLQDNRRADAATIATYAALQRYADFGQDTGCRVSDAKAAEKAGLSRRTFIDRRARLREMGWITWQSGKADGSVNVYMVHRSLQRQGVQDEHTPVQEEHTGSASVADPGVRDVHTTDSHSTESQKTHVSTTRAAPRAEAPPESRKNGDQLGMRYLLGLVRTHLYVPDGQPPSNWDIKRDGSIIKALSKRYPGREIEAAIIGLALLRDFPGVYGDAVDWLHKGAKVTLRALCNTRSGVLSMIERARQAYWKEQNTRNRNHPNQRVETVADVLGRATLRAS